MLLFLSHLHSNKIGWLQTPGTSTMLWFQCAGHYHSILMQERSLYMDMNNGLILLICEFRKQEETTVALKCKTQWQIRNHNKTKNTTGKTENKTANPKIQHQNQKHACNLLFLFLLMCFVICSYVFDLLLFLRVFLLCFGFVVLIDFDLSFSFALHGHHKKLKVEKT